MDLIMTNQQDAAAREQTARKALTDRIPRYDPYQQGYLIEQYRKAVVERAKAEAGESVAATALREALEEVIHEVERQESGAMSYPPGVSLRRIARHAREALADAPAREDEMK